MSDTVYSRYTVGAPTIDPATGWVYLMTTNGGVKCFNADGKIQWEYSLMERFGRLTFPNGRTGAAVIDGDLVIVRGVTSYWGKQGPARDRFYAFKKKKPARPSGPARRVWRHRTVHFPHRCLLTWARGACFMPVRAMVMWFAWMSAPDNPSGGFSFRTAA